MVKLQARLKSLTFMLGCECNREKKDIKVIEMLKEKISAVQLDIYKLQ